MATGRAESGDVADPLPLDPPPDLVVSGAELLWTGSRELPGGWLACRAGHVIAVGTGAPPTARQRLDARGTVVVPGLVDAHHHLLQSAFRTLPAASHDWLATMAAAHQRIGVDAELCRAAARVGLAEALLSGVTTVADHHLFWPAGDDGVDLASATAAAARDLGGRLVLVRGTAGDDPYDAATSADAIAAALDGVSGTVTVAVGPAGIHRDRPETFAALAEVAQHRGLRRRTQANQQLDVRVAAEQYGRRPLDLLAEWGWLAPDVTLAHLCGVSDSEVRRIAAAGATATHTPGCDLPMGWGVAPVAALVDAGIAVGLGTGGGGTTGAGHLLADARLALQVAPLAALTPRGDSPALTARQVLRGATAGSATGLGRADLGHLEPGAAADLACYDVTGPHDAGVADLLAGLVWARPGRPAEHVVVAGRVVVEGGELLRADAARVASDLDGLLAQRGRPVETFAAAIPA